jgi:hypothetical protein
MEKNPVPSELRILPETPVASLDGPGYLAPGVDPDNRLLVPFLKHMAADQAQFWTSPAKSDKQGAMTFAVVGGFTGLLISSDHWITQQIPDKPSQLQRSQHISNYAVYSLLGAGGGAYLLGKIRKDDHLSETGLLSGEAAMNSTAIAYLLKTVTQRPRPLDDRGNGTFFRGGNSFPSEHSAIAWSIASVVAHEYPGPLTKFLAYGLASTVTLTRVTGKQHFASDALIGSALGWYFGRQVYRAHHDPELGGAPWGELVEEREKGPPNPASMGSPDVPLDSWVYPALERLAALGYVPSAYMGMRPWTRMECARLLEHAGEYLRYDGRENGEAEQVYDSLSVEFREESSRLDGAANVGVSLDSVYTRFSGISGTPLRDGYHFGQTIINDYGRPYGEGLNDIAGVTAHAVAGPFSFDLQGEYQHAPAWASDSGSVLSATASQDGTRPLLNGRDTIGRLRLISGTVGLTLNKWRFSFGKQSLWLGPGDGGPFLFSDNAEPIPMLRISQVSPAYVPGLSRILGPLRTEFAVGRLSGTAWVFAKDQMFGPNLGDQPFVHIEKIGFRPTANLEFGMGISVVFGGPEFPVTLGNFFRTFNPIGQSTALPGTRRDPGDRRSTADFSYRIPHLRDWITLYGDAFVEDEASPIGSSRPAIRAGVYLPKLPKISKLDLRLESVYTDAPNTAVLGNYYTNGRFRSGYTNLGQLMGNWVGRAGKGGQAWATYWFSPQSNLQVRYRRQEVSGQFLEGGGLNSFAVQAQLRAHSDLSLHAFLQYETWKFPVLSPAAKSDVAASVQLTFYPHWRIRK